MIINIWSWPFRQSGFDVYEQLINFSLGSRQFITVNSFPKIISYNHGDWVCCWDLATIWRLVSVRFKLYVMFECTVNFTVYSTISIVQLFVLFWHCEQLHKAVLRYELCQFQTIRYIKPPTAVKYYWPALTVISQLFQLFQLFRNYFATISQLFLNHTRFYNTLCSTLPTISALLFKCTSDAIEV